MRNLFDETQLGSLSLENRFIRAAVHDKAKNGHVNEHLLDVYKGLAQGGVGTMITGFTLVDEAEKNYPLLAFYDDSFHDDHQKLVAVAHQYNKNIILQLVYVGSYLMGDAAGMTVFAPSAVENRNTKVMPQELSCKQIESIQQKFAATALRAKNAGYDGIELHAAHGFLLSQFMTPYYNRRNDLYGGTAQNRARMTLETVAAIRQAVGDHFPIWIKINVTDGFDGGVLFEDVLLLCKKLSQQGIDAIEISGALNGFTADATSFFKNEAATIASENDTAIILTGGNRDYEEMTEILNSTKISYFGMARSLIEKPDLITEFKKQMG
jgi:2,4-dienoyl-CoA reductase-like NADH-dependent reductase (Old Yellow Enzyme family)